MDNSQNYFYPRDFILKTISTIKDLLEGTAILYNKYDDNPTPQSIASLERSSFPNVQLIRDVHYRGILSMESAADHLMVYVDSISEPAKTIAPLTCVRGLLESCALAVWFLDPKIEAMTRVGRCFAFRYFGFVEQIKFLKSANLPDSVITTQRRLEKVEKDALSLGFSRITNRKGEIDGIGMRMPSIIELINLTLGCSSEYRLLSGIAHGHHWAISQISFETSNDQVSINNDKYVEKCLKPEIVFFASKLAVTSYSRVIWYIWKLYGWNELEIRIFLDNIYNELKYEKSERFWRQ